MFFFLKLIIYRKKLQADAKPELTTLVQIIGEGGLVDVSRSEVPMNTIYGFFRERKLQRHVILQV